MKLILKLLKPLSFLPAILMMYAIFTFSGQTGDVSSNLSYSVSQKIVEVGSDILDKNFDEYTINIYAEKIHYYVRKLGHVTEYFLLAVAISFPFYVYGLRGIALMIVAGGICVGFACLDEYHQSFIAGRSPSKRDVFIDSFGAMCGIILVRIFCWFSLWFIPGGHRKKRR